jgi:hypothetical protein
VVALFLLTGVPGPGAFGQEMPSSVQRISGNPYVSYGFFFVLAGFGVIMVFRGIKAR